MRFFKEPIMEGCTDYVATDIANGGPFFCLRVTYWDHYGFRGIQPSDWFNQDGATTISEEEFFEAFHKAMFNMIGMLGELDGLSKLNEANVRLGSAVTFPLQSGAAP